MIGLANEPNVAQAATGVLEQEQPARDRGRRGVQLYTPAVTASWRMRMLRKGNVPDAELAKIRQAGRAFLDKFCSLSLILFQAARSMEDLHCSSRQAAQQTPCSTEERELHNS